MAYTLKDAKPLCTKPEFELVTMAHKSDLAALGPARLRQKIARVRKISDKFRDESARQRREARGKADPRATRAAQGNERTVKKAEFFADVLDGSRRPSRHPGPRPPRPKPPRRRRPRKLPRRLQRRSPRSPGRR